MLIHTAAAAVRQGRLSPVELLDQCLQRVDRMEERVRAWVLVDREGARAVAEERAGIAGLRPPSGRVSCHGVMPLAPSTDHPGPMARCVTDLAILLAVIAGPDPLDPGCADRAVPDYAALLQRDHKPRLGRLRGLF